MQVCVCVCACVHACVQCVCAVCVQCVCSVCDTDFGLFTQTLVLSHRLWSCQLVGVKSVMFISHTSLAQAMCNNLCQSILDELTMMR